MTGTFYQSLPLPATRFLPFPLVLSQIMDSTLGNEGWPERFTAGVAAQIGHYRESRGLSFQQLADKCSKLGYPTLRTTLANLENGRRKSITMHEVLVISAALNVPPVLLLFPGLAQSAVEVLPGMDSPAFGAAQWFSGEQALVTLQDIPDVGRVPVLANLNGYDDWIRQAEPLELARRHAKIIQEWEDKRDLYSVLGKSDAETDQILAAFSRAVEDLRANLDNVRRRMTDLGMTLPPILDPIIYNIDEDETNV